MLKAKLGQAWNTWREYYLHSIHQIKVLLRALKHMKNRRLVRAWNTWRAYAENNRRLLKVFKRGMKHWMNAQLGRAMNKWLAVYDESIRLKLAKEKALLRWLYRSIFKGWNKWKDYAQERKRTHDLLYRALQHARHLMLAKAFNTWYSDCILWEAMSNWVNMLLKSGWRTWRKFYKNQKRAKRVAEKALRSWRNRLLSAAYRKWRYVMLQIRAELANRSWLMMRDASLRVQKEAAARLMRAFLIAFNKMRVARLVIQWRGNRISEVATQMMEFMNRLIAERDAARDSEEAMAGQNRVLIAEREGLELKLRMLEDDFRSIQSGVNGANRVAMMVEDLTFMCRGMEDKMRVMEAQRLRLHQEVMAGREAGETMELAIVELSRQTPPALGPLPLIHQNLTLM